MSFNPGQGAVISFSVDGADTTIRQIDSIGQAMTGMNGRIGASTAQIANAMRMVPAQLTDIVVGLQAGQAPLTVLLQQGGQLRDMFGSAGAALRGVASSVLGLVNPYTVAAATVGALALAYNHGSKEADAYSRAIIMSGNAAGTSVGQLSDYARAISQTVGTQGEAAEALTALVNAGGVSSKNLEQFGAVAVQAQKYIGVSAQDMAKDLASLDKAPVSALLKLDETYHFLTASTYEQVKALADQGKGDEAAEAAQKAFMATFADRSAKMKENLGDIEQAWMGAKDMAAKAWDAFLGVGRKKSAQQELDEVIGKLGQLKEGGGAPGVRGAQAADAAALRGDTGADKAALLRRKTELEYQVSKDEWQRQQDEISAQLRKAGVAWDQIMDKTLDKAGQKKREIEKVVNAGLAAGASDSDIKKAVAKVQEDFASLNNPLLTKLEGDRTVQREVLAGALADLESSYKQQLISQYAYINKKRDLQLQELDLEIGIIKQRAALDAGKEDKSAYQKDEADLKAAMQRRLNIVSGANNAINEDVFAANKRAAEGAAGYTKIMLEYHTASDKKIQDAVKEVEANERLTQAYGLTKKAIAELEIARLQDQLAQHGAGAFYLEEIENLEKLIAVKKRGAVASGRLDELDAGKKASEELDRFLDPAKVESLGDALRTAFGSAGDSIGKMTAALQQFGTKQAAIAKERANADAEYKASGNYEKYLDRLYKLNDRNTKEQLGSYGDMAAASASFFGEHSRGYQSLTAVSQVFHAAELAATTAELVPKAISAVLTQGEGDPYTAFGRMAAMGALVAGLGVAIGGLGGGADTTAKDRQAAQGSGSVFGDNDAKSESIKHALESVEKNTYQDLAINNSMLATLRSIDTNISSFASQLVRSTDITNPDVGALNTNNGFASTVGTLGLTAGGAALGSMAGAGLTAFTTLGAVGGPIGMVVGAVAGAILSKIPAVTNLMTSIFGGKQSVTDSGFGMKATSLASILGNGAHAFQYADIKTSGGWFGKDKTSEKTTDLSEVANQQFTSIITSLADAVKTSGTLLGLAGDDFANKLNGFVVDIGQVSLKDLKGDDLQKALESVFSKLGDDMARYAVGGLQHLQQVGEGYLETLERVSAEYQTIDVVFQSFGKTFGQIGLASIAARDHLVQLAGGLDKFAGQGEYFLTNFFSEKEQAAALQARIDPTLAQYGLSSSGEDAAKLFRNFIVGLDTTTEAGAQAYTTLMTIAPALKQVGDAQKDMLDQRKDLQNQLDELTMSSAQLLAKQRDALDESNRALFDQVQAIKAQTAATQAAKDAANTVLGGVNDAYSALQKVVSREKSIIQLSVDTHTAAFNKLQSLSQTLHSTLDSFKSPEQMVYQRATAQAEIRADLAITKAGGTLSDSQTESLKKALGIVTQDSSSQFSTYTDYMRDLLQTQSDVAQLTTVTDTQLSVEQKALDVAKAQLSSLDLVLKTSQDQIDVLKGVDVNGLTLIDAMNGLTTAILSAKENPIVGATSAINSAYQQYLGRAPDAPGLEWWQNAAASGAPVSQIVAGIAGSTESSLNQLYQTVLGRKPDAAGLAFWMNAYGSTMDADETADWMKAAKASPEYTKLHPFAVGTNFVPETMPALVHQGERIIPAADNRVLMQRLSKNTSGDNSNSALVNEIRALKESQDRMARDLQDALVAIARHTSETVSQLEDARYKPFLVEIAQ